MSCRLHPKTLAAITCLALVAAALWPQTARAQRGFGFGQSVGGVSIDAEGLLKNATLDQMNKLRLLRETAMQEIPGDLAKPHELRKVSLRRLGEALAQLKAAGQSPTDEMRYLAGLQRVRYVFVYPETHDIVLAGFAEGWKVDSSGNYVGRSTNRPVLLLDDLLSVLRTAAHGLEVITCSIDPTQEGLDRLRKQSAGLSTIGDPGQTARMIEQLMGPQTIRLRGIADTSHFARVLVAADYRMKRLGMGFDPAPVAGLPSYLQMTRPGPRGMQTSAPRWWLVPAYDPVLTDGESLAWELRGASVKCLTEETLFSETGAQAQPGKANPIAQQWAKNFTERYDELSVKDSIFGQLRNCMDLAIVSALIFKENLVTKAGFGWGVWLDTAALPTDEYLPPKHTDTQVSYAKKGSNWVITASGGVEIQPAAVLAKTNKSDALPPVRSDAQPPADSKAWWWN